MCNIDMACATMQVLHLNLEHFFAIIDPVTMD